ncbi:MAG: hypothetical protein AAGF24_04295 [Cyanobacteria bacterium P01_H01_bin.121]
MSTESTSAPNPSALPESALDTDPLLAQGLAKQPPQQSAQQQAQFELNPPPEFDVDQWIQDLDAIETCVDDCAPPAEVCTFEQVKPAAFPEPIYFVRPTIEPVALPPAQCWHPWIHRFLDAPLTAQVAAGIGILSLTLGLSVYGVQQISPALTATTNRATLLLANVVPLDRLTSEAAMTEPNPEVMAQQSPLQRAIAQAEQASAAGEAAQTRSDWQVVVTQWKTAIALLETVPDTDLNYAGAQALLSEYQAHLVNSQDKADPFRHGVNSAIAAAEQGQNATTPQDWQQVAQLWERAIGYMQQVPESHAKYAIAQDRIESYGKNLEYIQAANRES